MMNETPLVLLYLNVLVIATCGLIYELLAGTLASYLLGDSVLQFSTKSIPMTSAPWLWAVNGHSAITGRSHCALDLSAIR